MSHLDRVIVLVDMDCFYCQVEEKLNPLLYGKPIAVVQYNAWQGGGIIAVNYPARDQGVTRHMRGREAKLKCPEIALVPVPHVRGKADLSKYREAGKRVAAVLQTFTPTLERASVDEAYLDITNSVNARFNDNFHVSSNKLKTTHVLGYENVGSFLDQLYQNEFSNESDIKLAIGGTIAEEIRNAVYEITGYKCSAGIAHNKILGKLVCGLHKPNQQTILLHESVPKLYENLPIRKIMGLGGKLGVFISEKLNIINMGELLQFSEKELEKLVDEKTGSWLYNLARGIDYDPVTIKLISKSIGCCKNFPGRNSLTDEKSVMHWLNELSIEISERLNKDLEENNRKAKNMIVNFAQIENKKNVSSSRTTPLNSYEVERIMQDAFEIIKKYCLKPDGSFGLTFLGISVGKFEDIKNVTDISTFFKNIPSCSGINNVDNKVTLESEKQETKIIINNNNSISSMFKAIENNNINKSVINDSINDFEKQETNIINKNSISSMFKAIENNNINKLVINDSINNSEKQETNITYYNDSINGVENTNSIKNMFKAMESNKLLINTNESLVNDSISDKRTNTKEVISDSESNDSIINEISNCNANLNMDYQSDDSITEELSKNICVSDKAKVVVNAGSFFKRYFDNLQIQKSPVKRNFDTSINLDEKSSDSEQFNDIQIEETHNLASTSFVDNLKELCGECNKLVLKSEMIEHLDYHFVIKMVKDESNLYKPLKNKSNLAKPIKNESNLSKPVKNVQSKTTSKKKSIGTNVTSLTQFLVPKMGEAQEIASEICAECNQKIALRDFSKHLDFHETQSNDNLKKRKMSVSLNLGDENAGASKICEECNKMVSIDDFSNHVDHHIAKKLHLEINQISVLSVKNKNTSNSNNKIRSVTSFFKPI